MPVSFPVHAPAYTLNLGLLGSITKQNEMITDL